MSIWYGSGSADAYLLLTSPDSDLFVSEKKGSKASYPFESVFFFSRLLPGFKLMAFRIRISVLTLDKKKY